MKKGKHKGLKIFVGVLGSIVVLCSLFILCLYIIQQKTINTRLEELNISREDFDFYNDVIHTYEKAKSSEISTVISAYDNNLGAIDMTILTITKDFKVADSSYTMSDNTKKLALEHKLDTNYRDDLKRIIRQPKNLVSISRVGNTVEALYNGVYQGGEFISKRIIEFNDSNNLITQEMILDWSNDSEFYHETNYYTNIAY